MKLRKFVMVLVVVAIAPLPSSANYPDLPLVASGYEIVVPTQIANLHVWTTHVVVAAQLVIGAANSTNLGGYGKAVAEVDAERSIDEELVILIETHPMGDIFEAKYLNIKLYLCNSAPIEHLGSGEPMEYYTFLNANVWAQTPVCFEPNSPNAPNFAHIENWDNSKSYVHQVDDLVRQ